MGPVVFLAMVNDVASAAPSRWKYVNGITVGESRLSNSTAPSSSLPGFMNNISNQGSCDHMTLNVSKCGLMQLSFGGDPPSPLQITANDQTVPLITSMTLLGLTIRGDVKIMLRPAAKSRNVWSVTVASFSQTVAAERR